MNELNKLMSYMKQYVENEYEHDSEPMLNYKDLQLLINTIEAYENIRKEAIEYIKNDMKLKNYFEITERGADDLLNILNKVGGSDE